jgi:ABC-type multidrug transport system fused ATPase/permease subunit
MNSTKPSWKFFGLTFSRVASLALLTLVAAMFEGFGMAMFLPILDYVEKGGSITQLAATSGMWQGLISAFEFIGIAITLPSLLVAAVGTMLLRVLAVYARQAYSAWLKLEIQHVCRSNLFNAYMAMNYSAYKRLASGDLINALTTESLRTAGHFAALFALWANIAVVVGFSLILFWLSAKLTLLALLFLGISSIAVAFYVRHTRTYSHAATGANEKYSKTAIERINAFRLIKLTDTVTREVNRTERVSREIAELFYWLSKLTASIDLIMEPLVLISGGVILYFAVNSLGMSLAEIGLFFVTLLRILPLMKEVMKSKQSYDAAIGSVTAVVEHHNYAERERETFGGTREFIAPKQGIQFRDVSFSYPNSRNPTLKNIDLLVPAGKITALIGPSGAGKSTLVDLIPRLIIPEHGDIRVDGVAISEFALDSLRRRVAYVSQDTVIFDESVAWNLRFVRPDATNDDIWNVLARAQADKFVRSLDRELETKLGEKGTRLSGGQKQRLALARALLQEADILILDEPTSALDSEAELEIQKAIEDLRSRHAVTIIVIAHRLSTIRSADKIVVIDSGRVIQEGRHEELLRSQDWYSRMSHMQIT